MVDDGFIVVWQADWQNFGSVNELVNTVENNFRFPGQYYDSETGFYYNFHRYYEPDMGRYLREDPVESGINFYVYVGDEPVISFDFYGLDKKCCKDKNVRCWIVCDWANVPGNGYMNKLHCWLEKGKVYGGFAKGNDGWEMYSVGRATDRVGWEHGDRWGWAVFKLSEKCCCEIDKEPNKFPYNDPYHYNPYYINGVCTTALHDYLCLYKACWDDVEKFREVYFFKYIFDWGIPCAKGK